MTTGGEVLSAVSVARRDTRPGRTVHPPYRVQVSSSGQIGHISDPWLWFFVNRQAGTEVMVESTEDGTVVVTDVQGREVARRSLRGLQTGAAPRPGEELVATVPADVVATDTANVVNGYVDTGDGWLPVGRAWRDAATVGVWYDGDARVYFDQVTRVVLGRKEPHTATFRRPPAPRRVAPGPGVGWQELNADGLLKFLRVDTLVRAGLNRDVKVERFVTDDGLFLFTHPHTGERLMAGWLPNTPLTPAERSQLGAAWAAAGHAGDVAARPVVGQPPPPVLPGDVEGTTKTGFVTINRVLLQVPGIAPG
jgi:hypothetical protein